MRWQCGGNRHIDTVIRRAGTRQARRQPSPCSADYHHLVGVGVEGATLVLDLRRIPSRGGLGHRRRLAVGLGGSLAQRDRQTVRRRESRGRA
eukprot:scaffold7777_cov471-Prasinococcus_capsulatus_cf.AAC.2